MPTKWPEKTVRDWREFEEWVAEINPIDDVDWIFRGQADSSWPLRPSLTRLLPADLPRKRAVGIETSVVRRFGAAHHLFAGEPADTSQLNWIRTLMLAQHHGCPTRLLDWAQSPYVAAYFAVREERQVDAAVWFLRTNVTNAMKKRGVAEIRDFFEDELAVEHPYLDIIVEAISSTRSAVQGALYTISPDPMMDHDQILGKYYRSDVGAWRVVIPASLRMDFLWRLRGMNVTALSLFPDLDGLGRSIHELIRLRIWSGQ